MILSDVDIKKALADGRITVDPFDEKYLQPASIDLRLGKTFLVFRIVDQTEIDLKKPVDHMMERVEIDEDRPFILHPGEFALGMTYERTGFGPDIVGRLEGKSSLGRVGVIIHATAGYIDPGNSLHPTLELHNISPLPVKLYYKMPIAQMSYHPLSSVSSQPYGTGKGNKYYGDTEPKASQYYKNFLQ